MLIYRYRKHEISDFLYQQCVFGNELIILGLFLF